VKQCQQWIGGESLIKAVKLFRPIHHERVLAMESRHDLLTNGVGARGEIRDEEASPDNRTHSHDHEKKDSDP
jgi:hypothetical protein